MNRKDCVKTRIRGLYTEALTIDQYDKNEKRYPQQAESSAIRFPIVCRSFL